MTKRDNSAVFGAAAAQQTPPPAKSQKMPGDELFEVPIETIPLPSMGKIYPPESGLHMLETVDIKAMTAKEEDILTSGAHAKKGTMLSALIRSCLIDKRIDPSQLVIGDRYAILLAIRITGYGDTYTDTITCGECDVASKQTFNMGQFPLKRLQIEPVNVGENLFSFKLPRSGHEVKFRLMTGRDEEEMHQQDANKKKAGFSTDTNVTSALTRTIVSVNNVTDMNKIARYVREAMPAADSSALRKYMSDNQPGITFEQEIVCPACEHKEVVAMPMGLGFLWPLATR